jgi:hypothetical protein
MLRLLIILTLFFPCAAVVAQECELPELVPFKKGNKWGYSDTLKKIKIAAKYDEAGFFSRVDGTAEVKIGDEQFLIDKKGKKVEKKKTEVGELSAMEGIAMPKQKVHVTPTGKYGLKSGSTWLLDTIYRYVYVEADGDENDYAIVKDRNGKWGTYAVYTDHVFMSTKGFDSLSFPNRSITLGSSHNMILTYLENKVGWYLTAGDIVEINPKYDRLISLENGNSYLAVGKNNKLALANDHGVEITGFKFDNIKRREYHEPNLFLVTVGKSSYYIDCKGTEYFEK